MAKILQRGSASRLSSERRRAFLCASQGEGAFGDREQGALFQPADDNHIVGMDLVESDALLDRLFDHQDQERFLYRYVWKLGDLLLRDNRSTLHARSDLDASERHKMWRPVVVREH